ncbi:MAG: acetyl-CoA carboxylase biotin carboxyl carrier protein subunit [Vicinamibacterales bacterium]
MTTGPRVTRVDDGMYCVEHEGGRDIVYVAGTPEDRWFHWNGRVFRRPFQPAPARPAAAPLAGRQFLSTPMPATVLRVLAAEGDRVRKGDTLVVLEAMKMELPIRAESDAAVVEVRCREGDLVQADAVLVELEA